MTRSDEHQTSNDEEVAAFIRAASVPRDSGHGTGTLDEAQALLRSHPGVARASIHTAALLGDDAAVREWIERDPGSATVKEGPYGWDPLTCLCFSRYLRLDPERSAGFERSAAALLDAGADANTGWHETEHEPRPVWESAIYGAAGVAHHAGLTRLLLEHGADPNDEETPYHTPETRDNDALKALVESGKVTDDSLCTMLIRKADWHDLEGVTYLLEHGADPNRMSRWRVTPLHQAVRRDNALANVERMLDHGGDPTIPNRFNGMSAVSMAARRGRGDLLALFEKRGFVTEPQGVERLIAACARSDASTIGVIVRREPALVRQLVSQGGTLLAEFSGVDNVDGVRHLLNLGVAVTAAYAEGDGYFGIAPNSLAIHVAAWRAAHATVKLLIERGSPVDSHDGWGRTPLALAVRACVDSYWTHRRSPASVDALVRAGASAADALYPCGYDAVDAILRDPQAAPR